MDFKNNITDIQKSFGVQAQSFDNNGYHLLKAEYQQYMIDRTEPQKTDRVLEVAAGTCICGRAFAPYVAKVTCLDATPAMLQVGREEAEKAGLVNMEFVEGMAENLPFADKSFDIVMSRLAFHHFVNPDKIFAEMKRVLKLGGKLILMDMTVQEEELRDKMNSLEKPQNRADALEVLRNKVDFLERMRDFSHVRDLTLGEMRDLYSKNGLQLLLQEQMDIPVSLSGWMALTHTPKHVQEEIIRRMEQDMAGGEPTGFAPYRKDGEIYFNHHWVFNMGTYA